MSSHFWGMSGYAVYVWCSFAAGLAVYIWNLIAPRLRRRAMLAAIAEAQGDE